MDTRSITKHATLAPGLRALARRDGDLRRVVKTFGPPPVWGRKPGFPTLVQIILEQQVSLASGRATFEKLLRRVNRLTPGALLELDNRSLKKCGFSRQKTEYCKGLAAACKDGRLVLRRLESMDDEGIRSELTGIKGIGKWSADVYLLMALHRPDVWPVGDLALVKAIQQLKKLPARPDSDEIEELGDLWRPWRSVAARILWHFYLSGGDNKSPA